MSQRDSMMAGSGKLLKADDSILDLAAILEGLKAKNATTVAPSDAVNLTATPTSGLYIGTSGDAKLTLDGMPDGTSVTLKGLAPGVVHPLSVKRVWATGTTATDIVAVY